MTLSGDDHAARRLSCRGFRRQVAKYPITVGEFERFIAQTGHNPDPGVQVGAGALEGLQP
jgi:formylglycine-generating enzyme required for sulfatase activity